MAANAWPGFVDILSAVVIMFVFFVLITAAVLYFYTLTYKAKVEGQPDVEVVAAQPSLGAATIEELEAENSELKKQIESAQTQASQGGGTDSTEVPSDTQAAAEAFGAQASEQQVMTSTENRSMVLFHDAGAITVEEESEEKIARFIDELCAEIRCRESGSNAYVTQNGKCRHTEQGQTAGRGPNAERAKCPAQFTA